MSISVRSRKAKGRKLQDEVALSLANTFNLEFGKDKDLKGRQMGGSGTDVVMSKRAKELIPFDIETKCQEKWQLEPWWKQTLSNTEDGRKPLLIIRKNFTEPLAVIRYSDLLEILNAKNSIKSISNDEILKRIKLIIDEQNT